MQNVQLILNDLVCGLEQGLLLGLLIRDNRDTQFVITKILGITRDSSNDESDTLVQLRREDINGMPIHVADVVRLKDIHGVRIYHQLKGL